MKKFSFIFMIGILSFASMIKASEPDFVLTGTDVLYFKKVRYGLNSDIVGIEQSGKIRYSSVEVTAFRKNGHVYEKMPVISNNKETGKFAFMELLGYRSGLKVYRHPVYTGHGMEMESEYLVFRDGHYHVRVDEKNFQTLTEFFFR